MASTRTKPNYLVNKTSSASETLLSIAIDYQNIPAVRAKLVDIEDRIGKAASTFRLISYNGTCQSYTRNRSRYFLRKIA